jgi:hypothetical protein
VNLVIRKHLGKNKWCIMIADQKPREENYYCLVAHGFSSELDARIFCTLLSTFPRQMCWKPQVE